MRFCLIILLLFAVGCNADPRSRRETALLRAEIIDLEDKYYLTKSKYESAIRQLESCQGGPVDASLRTGISQSPIIYDDEVIYQDGIIDDGAIIYDDAIIYGDDVSGPIINQGPLIHNGIVLDGSYIDGEIVYGPITQGPIIETPASPPTRTNGNANLPVRSPAQTSRSVFDDQSETMQSVQEPLFAETNDDRKNVNSFGQTAEPDYQQPTGLSPDIQPLTGESSLDLQFDVPDEPEAILPIEEPVYQQPENGTTFDFSDTPALNPTVTEIVVDSLASHPENVDRLPGDDGLVLLLQPRSSNGEVIPAMGQLTVSIIDPKQIGHRQRIGLWKFSPEETALFIADGQSGDEGILLRLPWEHSTPQNNRLRAFVRFVTSDGRKLETATDFEISPPTVAYSASAPLIEQWTLGGLNSNADTPRRRRSPMQTVSGARSMINRPRELAPDDQGEWIPSKSPHMLQNRTIKGQPVERKRIKPPEWKPAR